MEKPAFDLILDLVLKIDYYNDGIFFIDEPEIHMHTSLQSKLIKELYNIIPDNSQLWITTHSIGIMRMAERILKENPNSVAILDFDGYDFDSYVTIKPTKLSKTVWKKFLSLALDDLSELIIPECIILSEGSFSGNKIFNDKYPNILFISGGSSEDITKDDLKSVKGEIYNILKKELSLAQYGNTADAFIINNLVPLITPDTEIYKVLEVDIIKKIIP